MKPTLTSLALLSLLAFSPLHAATFLVDGVTTSGGYYDVHKGYDGKDENMCWAAASSNVLQYWQDYYGVFYKGDAPLPNGASAYTGEGVEYGKRCLAVYEEFRNNWENREGNAIKAMAWWMYGKTGNDFITGSNMVGDNSAGYFKEYFESPNIFAATDRYEFSGQTQREEFDKSIIQSFGNAGFNSGRVCYLSILVDLATAHALTCYGYETNEVGQVTGLWLCNSDDRRDLIFLCDIKKTETGYVLVNHSTGENWTYSGFSNWKISQIAWINTPERLVNMQKAYSTADLVWNGGSTDWVLPETTRGVLPTEASGWEASAGADEGMFDSFFADGRRVVFDGAGNGTVRLHGDLAPASVLVDTATRNYSFTGTGRLAGETTTLTVRGGGSLTIATSNTYGGGTTLLDGETVAAHQNALGTGSVFLQGGTLNIFGTGTLGSLDIGGDLTSESGSILFDLTADGGDKLTVAGGLNLESVTFELNGTGGGALGPGVWTLAEYGSCILGTITTQTSGLASPDLTVICRAEGNTLYAIISDGSIGDMTTLDWKDGAELWTFSNGQFTVSEWHDGNAISISGYATVNLEETVTPADTVFSVAETTTLQGAGTLAGTGSLVKQGGGKLVIATANTYSGGTRLESGTIALQNAQGLGAGAVIVTYGKLDLNGYTLENDLTVAGTAILDNAANFTGTLTLQSGVLSGNAGIQARAYEVRGGSSSLDLGGTASKLVKTSSGRVVLSGNNTYGGGTSVKGGTLEAGSASAFGTGAVRLEGGTLDAASQSLANAVHIDRGENRLLRADHYKGDLHVHGGGLSFGTNGGNATATAASLTMNGGRLDLVSHDGTSPALHVAGDVSITGGALGLTLALNETASPLLAAGGNWSISGTEIVFGIDALHAPDTLTEGEHTYVLAQGSSGVWSGNSLTFTQTCSKYFGPDNVVLREQDGRLIMDVTAALHRFYTNEAVFSNLNAPARTGAALLDEALIRRNPQQNRPESELAGLMNAIDKLADDGRAGVAAPIMAAFSGNATATLTAALAQTAFERMRSIRNRLPDNREDWTSSEGSGSSFWMEADSGYASLSSQNGAAGYTNSAWGGTVGCDTLVSPGFLFGAAFSALSGSLDADAAEQASGHLDTYTLSLYAQGKAGRWSHTAVLAAGLAEADLDRTVSYGSGRYTASGTTNGSTLAAGYELAFEAVRPDEESAASFSPLASFSVTSVRLKDYDETGAGNAGLRVSGMDRTFGTAGLGFRASLPIGSNLFNREAFLSLRMAVLQDIGSRRGCSDVRLSDVESPAQRQKSADVGSTGFEAGMGMTIPLEAQSSLFFDVQADFRAHQSSIQGTVGYRYFF